MLQELAKRKADSGDGSEAQASELLEQGITKLRQAAQLDPRIAPLVQKALAPLMGGEGAPELSASPSGRSNGSAPTPGGVVPTV